MLAWLGSWLIYWINELAMEGGAGNKWKLTLFQAGGGGIRPSRFFLRYRHKYQPICKFSYRDIIWQKIKFITSQGVTWSLFCRKHNVSPHIFTVFTFSSSTFFLTFIFSVKIFWENILLVIFSWKHWNLARNFADVSISEKIQNFDDFSGFLQPRIWQFPERFGYFPIKM